MKLAVIGAGVIGRLRAQTVVDHPDTELVGIADVDRVAVTKASQQYRVPAYADYRQLIDECKPDAVIISSPVTLHREMCEYAFSKGCHVLVEKPMSNSIEGCQAIMRAAAAAKRTLAVGFNHRFYTAVKYLRQVLDEGKIGTIDHVRIFGGHDGLHNFRADWMFKGELSGGGAMMDVGIHLTDLGRYLTGEVTEVYGFASGKIWNVPGSEDNAVAVMRTTAGVPIIYQTTWTEWRGYGWYVDVYGTGGMVRASYAPMFNLLITQDKPGGKRTKLVKRYPEIIVREKVKGWQTTSKISFDDELKEFLRMVQGAKDARMADGWSGLRANEIAQAVYRSTASGDRVVLSTRGA